METIKDRGDFLAASSSGKRFSTSAFIILIRQRPSTHPAGNTARFGFTVSKKMGNAVRRNRIKRRLREAVRKIPTPLVKDGHDYVIISRQKSLDCPFADLIRDMEFAFSRIPFIKDNHTNTKQPPTPS